MSDRETTTERRAPKTPPLTQDQRDQLEAQKEEENTGSVDTVREALDKARQALDDADEALDAVEAAR